MNIRNNPAHSSNYTSGRQGVKINKIIVHHAATTSFDGIAATFANPSRNASAHYGVGRNGAVDRYVDEGNIAWHCGNWAGNQSSVGIENVNLTGAPAWQIADDTFGTLVELVRDIAKRNGLLPLVVGRNLFGHKDFMATACPGQLYGRLQELADKVNGGSSPAPTPAPGRKSNATVAQEVLNGAWGNNPERRQKLEAAGYDYNAIQAIVNGKVSAPKAPARKSDANIAGEVLAGLWGNNPERKRRLEAAGYNYQAIQNIVNGAVSPAPRPTRKSNDVVAREIINGQGGWGNNPGRKQKLEAAGYNYHAIQAIINRLV